MFSFFKKNKIPVVYTDEGSHGRHWYSVFGEADEKLLIQHLTNVIQSGEKKSINKNTAFIDDHLIRAIMQNDFIVTGFPYWKGTRYEDIETKLITEWSHVNHLEAIVQAAHSSGCKLDFFAIDYAFHKEQYTNQKNIKANIVGFAYVLEDFDVSSMNKQSNAPCPHTGLPVQFSEDFCGYFPTNEPDEISFVGNIKAIQDHALGQVEGFIITISLTPDFTIDTFIAKANLKIELAINKQVAGLLWLIGTLEK